MVREALAGQILGLTERSEVLALIKPALLSDLTKELSSVGLQLNSKLTDIHASLNPLKWHIEGFECKRSEANDVNKLIDFELSYISKVTARKYEVLVVDGVPQNNSLLPIQVFEPELMGYWCSKENINPTVAEILPFFNYGSFHPDYGMEVWEDDVHWKLRGLAEGVALYKYKEYLETERLTLNIKTSPTVSEITGLKLKQLIRDELLHLSKPWFGEKKPMFENHVFEKLIELTYQMITYKCEPKLEERLPRIQGAHKSIIKVSYERLYYILTGKRGKNTKRPDYWFKFLKEAFLDFYNEVSWETLRNKCTIYERKLLPGENYASIDTDIEKLLAQ